MWLLLSSPMLSNMLTNSSFFMSADMFQSVSSTHRPLFQGLLPIIPTEGVGPSGLGLLFHHVCHRWLVQKWTPDPMPTNQLAGQWQISFSNKNLSSEEIMEAERKKRQETLRKRNKEDHGAAEKWRDFFFLRVSWLYGPAVFLVPLSIYEITFISL